MIIRTIEFDKKEQPESLTVEMSVAEAAVLAQLTGTLRPDHAKERGIDYEHVHSSYDALVGGFFNRLWDDGVNDYLKGTS